MRVVVAEDAGLLRAGIVRLLRDSGFDVVAEAACAEELLVAVEEHEPDVVVTDVRMPPGLRDEGLRAADEIRRLRPSTGVLVFSQYAEPAYLARLLASDARGVGYLLKDRVADIAEFTDAIRRVAAGQCVIDADVVAEMLSRRRTGPRELSPREVEILGLMAEGRSNAAIGDRLVLSPKTVDRHIGNIFTKLGLPPAADDHRRVLAVLAYLRSSPAGAGASG